MTKGLFPVTLIAAATLLAGGCATKKYVKTQTAPIQTKVDQVAEHANKNTSAIEETNKSLKEVDERAATGISAAKERAMTAENRAGEAYRKAEEAGTVAASAKTMSEENRADLASLRGAVANIDDYQPLKDGTVLFGFDKASLDDEALKTLDALAADAAGQKHYIVAVKGYTDQIGSADYNAALSRRRADAVVRYLVSKHNLPLHRIHTLGLGQENLVDEGKTRTARAKNRRVEVKVFVANAVDGVKMTAAGR
jgi:OOP family OmpA-OmpF porin